MGTEAPTTVVLPVRCAPKTAPCPDGGTRGRRKRTPARTVRTVAYQAVAVLEVPYGESAARCGCRTTFRNSPEGVPPGARDDTKVRDRGLDRLRKDGLSIERARASIRRECLPDLSTGFVYDVLRDHAASLDMAAHRRRVLEHSRGTLCVDELHLGRSTLLLATDPLADLPVAFAPVDKNDAAPMRRSLEDLKARGLTPRVVVTDGSNPYPELLAELGPEAGHPLCVSHALKAIHGLILDAVRRLKAARARRGPAGRKRERGRKSKTARAAAARRGPTLREKAHFVSKPRYLSVKRRETLTEAERPELARMPESLPGPATLRRSAARVDWLFDAPKDVHQASGRRSAIGRDPAFRAVPELVQAMEQFDGEEFPKLRAYLPGPASRRVRTNDPVERTNRLFRSLEKVRYKWRRRRTLVRFVVLKLDEVGSRWAPPKSAEFNPEGSERGRETHLGASQRSRPAA